MFEAVEAGPSAQGLPSGTMLDDKYRIERLLAVGGMGVVYLGTHTKLRKRVAIKVLGPQHGTATMIERFHREAIHASQIGHEGIAQVTDLGTSAAGEPFLVMEYLEGESLASRLRARGPLEIGEACRIGCGILSPLGAAHRADIVHRDLKPDNVFLARQSRGELVKLLDFGIARAPGLDLDARLTTTGLVLGTPLYMAPEQARGESAITPAADLYAFGVMLYEMLVGDVPIRADNYNQLIYRVIAGDFVAPRKRRPDLPADLEVIILHAMALAPADRPASAAAIEELLTGFVPPSESSARGSRPALPGTAGPAADDAEGRAPPGPAAGDPRADSDARAAGRPSRAGISPGMYDGATISDTVPDDVGLPPDDPRAESVPGPLTPSTPRVAPAVARATPSRPMEAAGVAPHDDRGAAPRDEPRVQSAAPPSAAPRTRPGLRWAALAATALVSAALAFRIVRTTSSETRTSEPAAGPPAQAAARPTPSQATGAAPTPTPTAASAPTPTPSPAPAARISLELEVSPPDAAITLDGAPIDGRVLGVVADGTTHELRFARAGYADHVESVVFRDSQRFVVQLGRAGTAPRGKLPSRSSPAPSRGGIVRQSPYQ